MGDNVLTRKGNKLTIEELEIEIQKKIKNFIAMLPSHVDKWKDILKEGQYVVEALMYFSEQINYVRNSKIKSAPFLREATVELEMGITENYENELCKLKYYIKSLTTLNSDLKSSLMLLERSTLDLDWERDSPLINGQPLQPPLTVILQLGHQFWLCFSNQLKDINEAFKQIKKEESIGQLQEHFHWNIDDCETINYFLAVTQYVINEKAVN